MATLTSRHAAAYINLRGYSESAAFAKPENEGVVKLHH
ncbi:hypothetical protein GPLA_2772 [Paraglaciecola polaris LMG 21857]|uniref:Uncharacterized protein n=1 Tax=Paraglaciecola polaris LMG 21857 TaxID=1129793 RepID=K6ZC34_9ALTE|nr:hypothetical protein GPLA_2772 [Paraglaciecola polaris LMG 21857]